MTRYERVPAIPSFDGAGDRKPFSGANRESKFGRVLTSSLAIATFIGGFVAIHFLILSSIGACNKPTKGYFCHAPVSHLWGQYSPFFDVTKTSQMKHKAFAPEPYKTDIPFDCSLDTVVALSRHGARGPTAEKDELYRATMKKIQANLETNGRTIKSKLKPHLESSRDFRRFLRKYQYDFIPDQLNKFGRSELRVAGQEFHRQYYYHGNLRSLPFLRASGQERVVESAVEWREGFMDGVNQYQPRTASGDLKNPLHADEIPILQIPEAPGSNNTLQHLLCTNFEHGEPGQKALREQDAFKHNFYERTDTLNRELFVIDTDSQVLDVNDTINLMQLCAFDTIDHKPLMKLSNFCHFFNKTDFENLDHYETLDKWYGYGRGNDLGMTQGVGWANELLARLNDTAVVDRTSVNHTLDSKPETFPLPRDGTQLFVDFTHDNILVAALSALGLYSDLEPNGISNDTKQSIKTQQGFSSSWVCPFAGRVYVEKMTCPTQAIAEPKLWPWKRDQRLLQDEQYFDDDGQLQPTYQQYVRFIVNGRVMPIGCAVEGGYRKYSMCKLEEFVNGPQTEFVRNGGKWDDCFT